MDHNKLHQIVTDAEGIFCGGYVRAWLSAGEPVNDGFRDIDVIGVPLEKRAFVSKQVYELTDRHVDFSGNPTTVVFYANTWLFDGTSFYQNAYADSVFSPEETLEQIKQKQAVLMPFSEGQLYGNVSLVTRFVSYYGWTVHLNNLDLFNIFILHKYYSSLQNKHSLNIALSPSEQIMFDYASSKPKRRVEEPPAELPSLSSQVSSFSDSMVKWSKSSFQLVDEEELNKRLSICNSCEFIRTSKLGINRCVKCGCATRLKTKLLTENCPIGKW
jgi:hypothetical protein